MKKTSLIQKITLVLFGLAVAFICLEVFLRLGGSFFLYIQEKNNKSIKSDNDQRVILCIGESTTALGGKDSYPQQLEDYLNNAEGQKKFKVINKGIPGTNSTFIVENIEQWLNEYNPDIVVAMLGINDSAKLIPVHQDATEGRLTGFVKNLRTVKLFQWIKFAFQNKENNGPEEGLLTTKEKKVFDDAPDEYKKLVYLSFLLEAEKNDLAVEAVLENLIAKNYSGEMNGKLYARLARALKNQKKYRKLVTTFDKLPHYLWGDEWIANLCKKEEDMWYVLGEMEKLLKESPDSVYIYNALSSCYEENGDLESARHAAEKAANLRQSFINPVTQINYRKLIEILNKRALPLVFVQYPMREIGDLKKYFSNSEILKNIFFVDNEQVFKEAVAKQNFEYYFNDRFAGDFGHCTPAGNKLLAENVGKQILNQSFLNSNNGI